MLGRQVSAAHAAQHTRPRGPAPRNRHDPEHSLATEHEEALLGFKSFAVPIYDSGDSVIAALSLTVPVAHSGDEPLVREPLRTGVGEASPVSTPRLAMRGDCEPRSPRH